MQHGSGIALEDSGCGADTETFSSTRQDPYDQLDCSLFAVENRAMGLQKVSLTRGTVQLAPGAAARMPVGAQIPQPEPAPIVTIAVRTKVPGGVNLTGAPVRRCHGVGRYWRWWFGIRRVSCTQGTLRLVGQALEGLGFVGAGSLGLEGLGLSWHGRSRHRALGPGKVQDDKKPEECEQDELRDEMMRHHGVAPSNMS